jgi:hypothetical protein
VPVAQNDLLTTGQLGQELGLSRQWVDRIIRDAERLPKGERFPTPEVVLPNGARLFKRDPALQWFADHPRRPYGQKSTSGDPGGPQNSRTRVLKRSPKLSS